MSCAYLSIPRFVNVPNHILSSPVSAAVRLYYGIKMIQSSDKSYYASLFSITAYPEMSFGIIACCLPTTPKFINALKKPELNPKVTSHLSSFLQMFRPIGGARTSRHTLVHSRHNSGTMHSRENSETSAMSYEASSRPRHRRATTLDRIIDLYMDSRHASTTITPVVHLNDVPLEDAEGSRHSLLPYIERNAGRAWDGRLQEYVRITSFHP